MMVIFKRFVLSIKEKTRGAGPFFTLEMTLLFVSKYRRAVYRHMNEKVK